MTPSSFTNKYHAEVISVYMVICENGHLIGDGTALQIFVESIWAMHVFYAIQ